MVSDYPVGKTHLSIDNKAENELHERANKVREWIRSISPPIQYWLDTSKSVEELNRNAQEVLSKIDPDKLQIVERSIRLLELRLAKLYVENLTETFHDMAKLHVRFRFLWFEREARRFNDRVDFEGRAISRFNDETTDAEYEALDPLMKEKYDTPSMFSQESWKEFCSKLFGPSNKKNVAKNIN